MEQHAGLQLYIIQTMSIDHIAGDERIQDSPSEGDGQVEDGEHHGAAVVGEQVSNDCGRDG